MKVHVNKMLNSLTGKLIIAIGTLMVVGSTVFWYFLNRYEEQELINKSIRNGITFTDYVKKSTRHGMLTFRPELIQHTVEAMGSAQDVKKINIFNSEGEIRYSSLKEEIGTVLDINHPICLSCHVKDTPMIIRTWTISKDEKGQRILNVVEPIYNEPSCYTAVCHAHPEEKRVLGLVETDLSLAFIDKSIKSHRIITTAYVLIFSSMISVALCITLWKLVSQPLNILRLGIEQVGAGNLDYAVTINTRDEMEELAKVFNTMTSDLSKAKKELIEWGNTLEKKVEEKTEDIRRAQSQLIHSEKLASLGRMAAGVAHEINSPLTGIATFGHLLLKRFPESSQEKEDINVIIEQANRCSNIIKGLLGFARAISTDKTLTNINDVALSALNMVRHKAEFFDIQVVLKLDESLPPVMASASQLQQVFLNMIINAGDAMEGVGTLTIATRRQMKDGMPFVEVEVIDTGNGISEENMSKIFEPFFTTKPVGKGTGLGLAVSHGIIQDHEGRIYVKSKVGKGTSFFVRLPIYEGKT